MGEAIKLSGRTVPNGLVTLYIFSEPKRAEVTADGTGAWSYEITDLPAGSHHVEMEVKNPADGSMSDRVVLGAFTLRQPSTVASVAQETGLQKANNQNALSIYALVAASMTVLSAVLYRKQLSAIVSKMLTRRR